MTFENEINELEAMKYDKDYLIKKGSIPILFTAPHTMKQLKSDGSIKVSEPYTKAIALYLNKHYHVNCMVKINDTGLDSNRDNRDEFKTEMLRFIKENDVQLVIDLHGAAKTRNFDIEMGTMNHLSADFSTIKELEEAFRENGIRHIVYNDPFKGGAITEYVHSIPNVEVIQIEINGKYRDYHHIRELEQLCYCFANFIKQYKEYRNR